MGAATVLLLATLLPLGVEHAAAQPRLVAHVPANITPLWNKGIQPINRENYWNAVECGKQGGASPPCVFYDAGLCKNEDFTLALYTPYKMVAYTVWQAVSKKQDPPTPSYAEAQRTRVVLGITPVRGSKNTITAVTLRRGGRAIAPTSHVVEAGRGTFTFDFPAFVPTGSVTIEMTGRERTLTCLMDRTTLARLR
jgi:hypothetical protein